MQKWKVMFLSAGVLCGVMAGKPAGREMNEGRGSERVQDGPPLPETIERERINWLSIEDAAGKLKTEQRPLLIDLYTTWCGWCKRMDSRTYSNRQVGQYLQEKFYPVRVNAETHSVIHWKGREYVFNERYRSNEFAVYLTGGRLEFPTTIIIPPGGEPQAIPGYMEPKDLELLVKYFGEGYYNKTSFEDFQKHFKSSW